MKHLFHSRLLEMMLFLSTHRYSFRWLSTSHIRRALKEKLLNILIVWRNMAFQLVLRGLETLEWSLKKDKFLYRLKLTKTLINAYTASLEIPKYRNSRVN